MYEKLRIRHSIYCQQFNKSKTNECNKVNKILSAAKESHLFII